MVSEADEIDRATQLVLAAREASLQRADAALERADGTLAAPRPHAAAADEYETLARAASEQPAQARLVIKRAPEPPKHAPAPRATFDGEKFGDEIVSIVKSYVDRENALLRARVIDLETRLAQTEARLASVESKGKRK